MAQGDGHSRQRSALLGRGGDPPLEPRLWLRLGAGLGSGLAAGTGAVGGGGVAGGASADGWALASISEALVDAAPSPVVADSRTRKGRGRCPNAGSEPDPDGAPPLLVPGRRGIPSPTEVQAAVALSQWRRNLAAAPAGPDVALRLAARPEPAGRLTARGSRRRAAALVDSLRARQRLIAHMQAEQMSDLAELSGGYPGLREFLPTEIALALGVAESTARTYLDEATETIRRLPQTFAALHAGRITAVKVATIRTHTQDLPASAAALVERDVLGRAGRQTVPQLRSAVQRAVLRRDPEGAARRHESATVRRRVGLHPEPDGMAGLWAFGPAEDVSAVRECLFALGAAARTPGDLRTGEARAFDALVDVCTSILDTGSWQGTPLRRRRSARPHVQVTMPITALLGSDEPCELAGYGPITAAQARRIAADGVLTRMVCDPLTGELIDYGRTRYRPPDSLARFVQARDATCVMPGCRQPAHRNPIDHIEPFRPGSANGGMTDAANLAAPCEHHHRAKDGGGFTVTRHADGSYSWQTPLGYVHRREPTRYWGGSPPPGQSQTPPGARGAPARAVRSGAGADDPPPF